MPESEKIRSFGGDTPSDETCDWFGCNQIWTVKIWRLASLNEVGIANTPATENVLLCERHEFEGCKPACHWNELN